ncbi:MAG: peptidoglycan DD-metalloendopeptidase family protein [Bacteroidetes bacterium]|nr:peptidoglycan DD-metalloendopeptidase family protein [Bacteroidota bacterium]
MNKITNTVWTCLGLIIALQSVQAQESFIYRDLNQSSIWTKGQFLPFPIPNYVDKPNISPQGINDSLTMIRETKREQNTDAVLSPKLQLPISSETTDDPGFFTISAYFDHNPSYPNQILDYGCGDLSYDLPDGYNHSGTDFFIWPHPWKKMHYDEVKVIASAPGILYFKQDGNFDQNCENTNSDWNGCAVLHNDGSTSWYIHLKKNSLTTKYVGEEIEAGEYLGIVGSSGRSISPHLHFEIFNSEGNLIDPFEGPCNTGILASWWQDQLPYRERGINKISTNKQIPQLDNCPQVESTFEADTFAPGDTIYLVTYLRNVFNGDPMSLMIRRPDNSEFASWNWTSSWPFYSASWLYFFIVLHNDNYGTWKFEATYANKTYSHDFVLKATQSIHNQPGVNIQLTPNPVGQKLHITATQSITGLEIISSGGIQKLNLTPQASYGNEFTIDLSDYNPGLYIVRIKLVDKYYCQKVMVQ